ncbi:MAG: glycosyl transferase family 2, partial [uncultured bacterium]
MKPAIIIPVYNHCSRIGEVVRQSIQLGLPVFVVDDGSTDATGEVLAGLDGITGLRHGENQGKGAAILTGFAAAVEIGCDWAVTLDGDGQHNPADAKNLLQAAADGKRCIVIGSRQ